jgi:hypothetical protein
LEEFGARVLFDPVVEMEDDIFVVKNFREIGGWVIGD